MKKQIVLVLCGILGFLGYKIYKEERDHRKFIEKGNEFKKLNDKLDKIVSEDKKKHEKWANSFIESIQLAREVGVPEEEILHNIDEVDKFFLG